MDFVKYYEFTLQYHPRKENVISDALSRKQVHLSIVVVKGLELLEKFCDLNLKEDYSISGLHCGAIIMQN